jgi:hypothetical protein
MKRVYRLSGSVCLCLGLVIWGGLPSSLRAQNIQVTSATPPAAAQGTVNLDVVIGGKGFQKGAQAVFVLSGTGDTDGVMVNSTTFNGKTQLTANITIADGATIGSFDVLVYSSGRTGKGTGLFSVTQKGTPTGCTTLGTPSGFSLNSTLNYADANTGTAEYGPALGTAVQVRPVTLTGSMGSKTVLVAAVGSGANNGKLEIFVLDPATGQVLDGTDILGQVQPHVTVTYDPTASVGIRAMAAGDVNGDGIPDFVAGSRGNDIAFVFVGSMDGNGILSYTATTLSAPGTNPGLFGVGVAMGELDGSNKGDEVVVGASGGGSKGKKVKSGKVYIYQQDGAGFKLDTTLDDPDNTGESFGFGVAVGDVTGDGAADLVVGAPFATVNGASAAGQVYVFPAPLSSPSHYFMLATGIHNDEIGVKVGTGNVDGHTDVIAAAGEDSPSEGVLVFSGPIGANQQSASLRLLADPRLTTTGWATNADSGDMLGIGQAGFVVGVPNAANSTACNASVGAAELYLPTTTNLSPPAYTFQPPSVQSRFGWGVAIVPADATGSAPLLVVGENGATVGSTSGAGQVYVYKMN